jgi:hypothetical protein
MKFGGGLDCKALLPEARAFPSFRPDMDALGNAALDTLPRPAGPRPAGRGLIPSI